MSLPQVNKDIKYLCSSCSFGEDKRKRQEPPESQAHASPVSIDECSLCTEPLDPTISQITQLNCGHQFHTSCICRWFIGGAIRKFTCPLCRVVSSSAEINRLCQGYVPPPREPPSARRRISFDPDVLEDPGERIARGISPSTVLLDNGIW